MTAARRLLTEQAEAFWHAMPEGRYELILSWRKSYTCRLGILQKKPLLFRYEPGNFAEQPDAETNKQPGRPNDIKLEKLCGQALTRAGFQMPSLDPMTLMRLLRLRANPAIRLEFMLDTNAMVDGIGHFLARLFADRCDMVTTAVSLKELQDQVSIAQFSTALKETKKQADALDARQLYIASMRFREFSEAKRILWRELSMDDTALHLARGEATGGKASEADTAILRTIRRSIQDRVQGLERFLVTGDTALSRRATTELPEGSVITARVRPLRRGAVYTSASWWPGEDQGQTMPMPSAVRLFWELLCMADALILKSLDSHGKEDGGEWELKAFCEEMWPSDYQHPWILVDEKHPKQEKAEVLAVPQIEKTDASMSVPAGTISEIAAEHSISSPSISSISLEQSKPFDPDARLFPLPPWQHIPDDDKNYRFGAKIFLDALFALVEGKLGDVFAWPPSVLEADKLAREHLWRMLDMLQLVHQVDAEPIRKEGLMLNALRTVWLQNDWNALGTLLWPYMAFRSLIDRAAPDEEKKRPNLTIEFGRALASHLGQGMRVDGQWYPGGENPTLGEIRKAVIEQFKRNDYRGEAYTILDLCVEVFLKRLGVTPARAIERWKFLEDSGVFHDIEFRPGGSNSGKHQQKIVSLSPTGWELRGVNYESIQGYRDLKNRGARL